MLAITLSDSFGQSFGQIETLIIGQDFNCNVSICYGIGDRHSLFQELQRQLNTFARDAPFQALDVDGFIGPATLNAAINAAAYINSLNVSTDPVLISLALGEMRTKEQLAANAAVLHAALVAAKSSLLIPSNAPSTPSASQSSAEAIPGVSPESPSMFPSASMPTTMPASPKRIPNWVWWAGGAVGVITIGSIGYWAIRSRPHKSLGLVRRR